MGFLIVAAVVAVSILFGAAVSIVYVAGLRNRRRGIALLFGIPVLLLAVSIFWQMKLSDLSGSVWMGGGRVAAAEAYAILTGALVTLAALLPFVLLRRKANAARAERDLEADEDRRMFLKTAAAVIPTLAVGGASVRAFEGQNELSIEHIELEFERLPAYLDGYRIVQLTDLHIGPFYDMEDFDRDLAVVRKQGAERVVITGDLIDEVAYVEEMQPRLDALVKDMKDGVDYIFGNHEHIRDRAAGGRIASGIRATNMRVLVNESVELTKGISVEEERVFLAGTDYPMEREREEADIVSFTEQALDGIPNGAFTILLAHHPLFIGEAFKRNIPVTLTGHTHGGQINVGGVSLVPVSKPYWKGMYRDGDKYGYVSRGTGHWWPIRLNCPREITVFTFKKSNA